MENNECRIIFKDGEFVLINEKKPVFQIREELVVLGVVVSLN